MEIVRRIFTFVMAMLGFGGGILVVFSTIQAVNDRRASHPVDDKAFWGIILGLILIGLSVSSFVTDLVSQIPQF